MELSDASRLLNPEWPEYISQINIDIEKGADEKETRHRERTIKRQLQEIVGKRAEVPMLIMFGTKSDMKQWAGERIVDLKSRGFANAGLYDPPGVGGTHVMYVLHHADRPSLYAGLPNQPHISAFVAAWKGIFKPVALAGIAFTAIAGFFHWVVAGPNEVEAKDETEAEHLLQHADKPQ